MSSMTEHIPQYTVTIAGDTNVGKVRTNNEDSFLCQTIWDDNHLLVAAIDGMGGYEGGEVAAQLAHDKVIEYLEIHMNGDRKQLLTEAVCYANNAICEQRVGEYHSMGCVMTAALIEKEAHRVNMAHVGDTRLYQYSYETGELVKLSHDHSLVGYREELGELSEADAMKHPQRSVLDRALGSEMHSSGDNGFVESAVFELQPNSVLLFCSDGLCDMIMSLQMSAILSKKEVALPQRVQSLIDAALEEGGRDNVTVVLVETLGTEVCESTVEKKAPLAVEVTELRISENDALPENGHEIAEEPCGEKVFLGRKCIRCMLVSLLIGIAAGIFVDRIIVKKQSLEPRKNQMTGGEQNPVASFAGDSIQKADSICMAPDSLNNSKNK